MSVSRQRQVLTPERNAKIAAFHKGRKRSEETKAKMRAAWERRRARAAAQPTLFPD